MRLHVFSFNAKCTSGTGQRFCRLPQPECPRLRRSECSVERYESRALTRPNSKLEIYFADVLTYLVTRSSNPITVTYQAPEAFDQTPKKCHSTNVSATEPKSMFTINITSPAFYSRLIHYTSFAEALREEILQEELRNRTGWCSDHGALSRLLDQVSSQAPKSDRTLSPWTKGLLWIANSVRVKPANMSYPWPAILSPTASASPAPQSLGRKREREDCLPFDELYLRTESSSRAGELLATEIEIMFAERFALGSSSLLALEAMTVAAVACYVAFLILT